MANNIPGVNRILPLHNVVSQLNTLIADGTAINNVSNTKNEPEEWIQSRYKHMMCPNQECKNCNCKQ